MKAIINVPVLVDVLKDHVPGKVKFFKDSYGFITFEDGTEAFFHRNWLFELLVNTSELTLHPRLNAPKSGETVICIRREKPDGTFEAVDVINAVEAAFKKRELQEEYDKYCAEVRKLPYYKVTMIREEFKYAANNESKQWKRVKIGEKQYLVFEGNDVVAMNKHINSPIIRGALMQIDTRLETVIV